MSLPKWLSAGSLLVRLAALISIALLPLGLIALYQTHAVLTEADRLSHAAVLSRTERAASRERELLQRAGGATEGLGAAVLPVIGDSAACSRIMHSFTESQSAFTFAAFISADGTVQCSSDGVRADVSNMWRYQRAAERPQLVFDVDRDPQGNGPSQLVATSPVMQNGELMGFISIASPHDLTDTLFGRLWQTDGIEFATIDRDGEILSSGGPLSEAHLVLPASMARGELLYNAGETFYGRSVSGDDRFFAISEIIPGQVAVVGSWPAENAQTASGKPASVMTLAFPVIMWLTCIFVAVFGLHRLVIRHLRDLRAAMRRYALGERAQARLELNQPPKEFEEAQQSFNRMVAILSEAERRREQDLKEKTILLREVHHRVKNNLQLIASIMNMQGRSAQTPEARRMLSQLQRRIRGLATIHRTLNTNPDVTTIDAKAMIEELVSEIGSMNPASGQAVKVAQDLIHAPLGQDQAVTLSMLVSEAMTNAIKYVGTPEGGHAAIRVKLFQRPEDGWLALEIANTTGRPVVPPEESFPGSGLGERLMQAFAAQLEGEASVAEDGNWHIYHLAFPAEGLELPPEADAIRNGTDQDEPAIAS